jgi:hypothetical protein
MGRKGATPNIYRRGSSYRVQIRINYKLHYFGTYLTLEDAVESADKARQWASERRRDIPQFTVSTGGSTRKPFQLRGAPEGGRRPFLGTYPTWDDAWAAAAELSCDTKTHRRRDEELRSPQ